MCGRYTLTIDKSTIEKRFAAKFYIAKASYDYEATYKRRTVADATDHPNVQSRPHRARRIILVGRVEAIETFTRDD